MKFIVGSTSKRKIQTVENVIKQYFKDVPFEVIGNSADSGVPETPFDKETFDGSRNRALNAKQNISNGNYYIGLESGLVERYGHIYEEAWTTIITNDSKEYFGFSSGLKVPDFILQKMEKLKMQHGDIMALLEKEFNKVPDNDTWGTYSGGAILREVSLEESLRNALIQILTTKNSFYIK